MNEERVDRRRRSRIDADAKARIEQVAQPDQVLNARGRAVEVPGVECQELDVLEQDIIGVPVIYVVWDEAAGATGVYSDGGDAVDGRSGVVCGSGMAGFEYRSDAGSSSGVMSGAPGEELKTPLEVTWVRWAGNPER